MADTCRAALPLWLKLAYSAFMAVLVPVYWHYYGPTNFLYFCDIALILTLVGIWIESPLLISMCAVGILVPQVLWVVDFLGNLVGMPLIGMTDYMFERATLAVPARTVAVPRLAAVPAGLSGLEARLRPARVARLDRAGVGTDPDLLLLHAAAAIRIPA